MSGQIGLQSPGAPTILADQSAGGVNDIESGSQGFSGRGTCVKVDSDAGEIGNAGPYAIDIQTGGTYRNRICGTRMSFFGPGTTDGLISSFAPGWEGDVSFSYGIALKGPTATFEVTGGTWDGKPVEGSGALAVTLLEGDGDPDTQPCIDEDLTVLGVSGTLQLVAAEPPSVALRNGRHKAGA